MVSLVGWLVSLVILVGKLYGWLVSLVCLVGKLGGLVGELGDFDW